jgi:hypothetical protein
MTLLLLCVIPSILYQRKSPEEERSSMNKWEQPQDDEQDASASGLKIKQREHGKRGADQDKIGLKKQRRPRDKRWNKR